MNNKKMAQLITSSRKEKKLTQKELADQLGVTDKAVSKWERGLSYPDIALLSKISNVLGISINDLVNGETGQPSTSNPQEMNKANIPLSKSTPHKNFRFKGTAAGVAYFLLSCIILFLSISAIDAGLSWIIFPITLVVILWVIAVVGAFVADKIKLSSILFCGFLIFITTYYYSSLNEITSRDIAAYGEFNGFQKAYIPQYTIILIIFFISLVILGVSIWQQKRNTLNGLAFLSGAGSITLILISILTVSSIMDYVDIQGLGVNPAFTIVLLLSVLINIIAMALCLQKEIKDRAAVSK